MTTPNGSAVWKYADRNLWWIKGFLASLIVASVPGLKEKFPPAMATEIGSLHWIATAALLVAVIFIGIGFRQAQTRTSRTLTAGMILLTVGAFIESLL